MMLAFLRAVLQVIAYGAYVAWLRMQELCERRGVARVVCEVAALTALVLATLSGAYYLSRVAFGPNGMVAGEALHGHGDAHAAAVGLR